LHLDGMMWFDDAELWSPGGIGLGAYDRDIRA